MICSLIDGHPDVQVWPLELPLSKHFGAWLNTPSTAVSEPGAVVRCAEVFVADAGRRVAGFYEDFDLEGIEPARLRGAFDARLRNSDCADVASMILQFGRSVAEVLGTVPRVFMFDAKVKTSHAVALLRSRAPLRVVFMSRNPWDVYLALRAKHFSNYGVGNWLTGDCQPLLRRLVDHIVQYGGGPYSAVLEADPRVYVLHYKDLVSQPENVLSQVATWLGLPSRWQLMTVPTRFSKPAVLDRHAGLTGIIRDPGLASTAGRLSLVEREVLRRCFGVDSAASGVVPTRWLRQILPVLACLLPLAGEFTRFMSGHWLGMMEAGLRNRAYAARVIVSEHCA